MDENWTSVSWIAFGPTHEYKIQIMHNFKNQMVKHREETLSLALKHMFRMQTIIG